MPAKIERLLDRGDARAPFDYAVLAWKTDPYAGMPNIAHALAGFAFVALARHDTTYAARLAHDLFRLSDTLAKDPTLYAQLLRANFFVCAVGVIRVGLQRRQWNDAELQGFQRSLAATDLLPGIALAFRGERGRINQALEILTRTPAQKWPALSTAGPPPSAPPWLITVYLRVLGAGDIAALNRGVQQIFDAIEAAPRRGFDRRACRYKAGPLARFTRLFAGNFFYFLGNQPDVIAIEMVDARQTLVACALERFRLTHDAYPQSLAELVPTFLAGIPTDVRSPLQPLRYQRLSDDSFRLWAAGFTSEEDVVWQL